MKKRKSYEIVKNSGNVKKIRTISAFACEIAQEVAQKQLNDNKKVEKFTKKVKELLEKIFTNCLIVKNNIMGDFEGDVSSKLKSLVSKLKIAQKNAIFILSLSNILRCEISNEARVETLVQTHFENITDLINQINELKKIIVNAIEKVTRIHFTIDQIKNPSKKVNIILDQVQTCTNDVFNNLSNSLGCLFKQVRDYPFELKKAKAKSISENPVQMEEDEASNLVDRLSMFSIKEENNEDNEDIASNLVNLLDMFSFDNDDTIINF